MGGRVLLCDLSWAATTLKPLKAKPPASFFSAPELLGVGEYQGAAADMWAVGVLLFVLFTGRYPFLNPEATKQAKLQLVDLEEAQAQMLNKLLQRAPEQRWTAQQLCTHCHQEQQEQQPPMQELQQLCESHGLAADQVESALQGEFGEEFAICQLMRWRLQVELHNTNAGWLDKQLATTCG